jgi:2-oxoglutarate dehydrogenase E1 component
MPLKERSKVLPLLMHGDAAFAGQGVIAEMLGLSGLKRPPHRRHDAFHHQQPDRLHHQSATFALVALSVRRGQDDRGADLPRQRRRSGSGGLRGQGRHRIPQKFHKPVVIDMFCYRRFGHNEGDEPAFTQPKMYKVIRAHKTTLRSMRERLIAEGVITQGESRRCGPIGAPSRANSRPARLQAQQGRLARRRVVRSEDRRQCRRAASRQDRRADEDS